MYRMETSRMIARSCCNLDEWCVARARGTSVRKNVDMPMRSDCRHFESRSYAEGETVRKCRLDLAPEAPWRCPEDCPSYQRRTVDVAWNYGSLGKAAHEQVQEPDEMGADVAALLDDAEDIVNAAGKELLAEMAEREASKSKRFFRKKKKR